MVEVIHNRAHLAARMAKGKDLAGAAIAEAILSDSESYVPYADGSGKLDDSGRVEPYDGDYAVTWQTVYAAYQWYGCRADGSHVIRNHDYGKHANATTKWVDAAKARYKEHWDEIAQKRFVEGAGG